MERAVKVATSIRAPTSTPTKPFPSVAFLKRRIPRVVRHEVACPHLALVRPCEPQHRSSEVRFISRAARRFHLGARAQRTLPYISPPFRPSKITSTSP
jgi:hypothetical protein